MDGCGEDYAGVDGRDVRRRHDERKARIFEPHLAPPSVHWDDLQVAADTEVFVEHFRELSGRHSMSCRYLELADKGCECCFGYVAFNGDAVYWIRPIANDDAFPQFFRRAHAVRHCVNECIDTAAYVLQVKNDRVHILEHLLGRLASFTIER